MTRNDSQERRGGAPPDRAPQNIPPDEIPLATSRDSEQRREHRESPGSADTGRKGGSSEQTKNYPRTGRSSHS
jgi:hypothetical protein